MDDRVTSLNGFEAERERWETLYRNDPAGQVFLSWSWLRAYFAHATHRWTILLVREGDALVAALPLRVRSVPSAALPIARELAFASDPVADYQGMLCLPGREREAIDALARAIGAMRWDCASFRDVRDDRMTELLARLRNGGDAMTTTGETICRRVELPRDWASYVATLGSGTRATTTRSLRKLFETLSKPRLTMPTDTDIDAHVEAIVYLNHARWGGNLRNARATFGRLYRAAYDQGILRLQIMWDGERPVSGCVSFVDPLRRTYNLYKVGYDRAYGKHSPGKALLGVAIRDAIESGYDVFDFLRGDEDYKASYANSVVVTRHYRIDRPGLRTTLLELVQPSYRAMKAVAARVVYGPGRSV